MQKISSPQTKKSYKAREIWLYKVICRIILTESAGNEKNQRKWRENEPLYFESEISWTILRKDRLGNIHLIEHVYRKQEEQKKLANHLPNEIV